MRKLKAEIIDKLIEVRATGSEVDFLIWLSHYQNDAGFVRGVYYRNTTEDLHISFQTFYNAMRGLERKGIISVTKDELYRGDWDIRILNNDFSDQELRQGGHAENYLNTGLSVFYSREFFDMKANEKLMTMLYIKIAGAGSPNYHIGTEKFFEKYTEIFGVKKRALQNYLTGIKRFFSIGIKKREYWINPLRKKVCNQNNAETDRSEYVKQIAGSLCRRFRLQEPQKAYKAVTELASQYYYTIKKDIGIYLTDTVKAYLLMINGDADPHKWKVRKINQKLLHRLLREQLPAGALL
ncbi:MAG: hypothetical protein J6C33_08855 [Lachnospiraceae bacterium]|nr:hypothetical protein [Lachnospiraceae bacterium]